MILAQALQQSAYIFSVNGVEDSYVEARILLGHITKLSPAQIYARPEQTLSLEQERGLQRLIERRLRREPAAYIVNRKEFYGIDFYVDSRVLIPRPETEIIVEAALEFARGNGTWLLSQPRSVLIADVGTGCGAIAISLALNLPQSRVYATDISYSALEVAKLNCEYHEVKERVILVHGNLLEPVPEAVDIIIANLPYIKRSELLDLAPEIAEYEPRIALDGGRRGLDLICQLLEQAVEKINPRGCLLLEIGQKQEEEVVPLIYRYLKKVECECIPDLNGIKRVVKVTF
jgi:release factor glutamine methyltransferase